MVQIMDGKVALVTGAARGIGREIALELAKQGVAVAVNYLSSKEKAGKVVDRILQQGGKAAAFKADVSQVNEIELLFDRVIDHFGKLDILVNNAGAMINTPIAEVTEQEFDEIFDLNVKGLFFCCQQGAKRLQDEGRIVNIGTTVTKVMLPNYGTYAAGKGAVEQISRVLAKEIGHRGVTVNTVSPGPTDTELFRRGKSAAQIDNLASMSAFNRIAEGVDIARVVVMVCNEEAAWLTGQNIFANGGFIA